MLRVIRLLLALSCLFAGPVRSQDAGEISFWRSVKDSGNPAEIQAYLDAYPHGKFVPLAQLRLKALQKAKQTDTSSAAADKINARLHKIADITDRFLEEETVFLNCFITNPEDYARVLKSYQQFISDSVSELRGQHVSGEFIDNFVDQTKVDRLIKYDEPFRKVIEFCSDEHNVNIARRWSTMNIIFLNEEIKSALRE